MSSFGLMCRYCFSVLHSPVRTAVQTVWTGSVQSRPPVFLDCMKTVRPVRTGLDCSRLQSTAKTRILRLQVGITRCHVGLRLPRSRRQGKVSKTATSTRSTGTIDPPVPTNPRRWQDHAARNPKLRDSRQLMCTNSDKHPLNRVQSASYRQHPEQADRGQQ